MVVLEAKRLAAGTARAALGMAGVAFCLLVASGCENFVSRGLNAEGVTFFEQGNVQAARRDFELAVHQDPTSPDGYYNLAATYHKLGDQHGQESDYRRAEHYYHLCLSRDPYGVHRECYRGLASLLAAQDRKDEAFRLLQAWGDRRPTSAEPTIEMARLLEEHGKEKEAEEQLLAALYLEPNNARARAALGRMCQARGEDRRALANYRDSLQYNQNQPAVRTQIAALEAGLQPNRQFISGPEGTRVVVRGVPPIR